MLSMCKLKKYCIRGEKNKPKKKNKTHLPRRLGQTDLVSGIYFFIIIINYYFFIRSFPTDKKLQQPEKENKPYLLSFIKPQVSFPILMQCVSQ